MLVAIAAALSLASSLTIDIPYLPQTDALCGGAAAAMVFRYWGDAHADPQQFAPLIERRRGATGIATDVLVRAIDARGWRTGTLDGIGGSSGGLDALRARLAARQPVIVLLADRGDQYHYVVVVGLTDEAVVVHDPSWGPSRAIPVERFASLWRASGSWAVVVLPGNADAKLRAESGNAAASSNSAVPAAAKPSDSCDASVQSAVAEIRSRGIAAADDLLEPLRKRCTESPALMRELAGVRFAQKRWRDSETLARRALQRDAADAYAAQVLGAALFMQNEPVQALRAWNAAGQPRLDLVRISGLTRSRYQTVVEAIGLEPGALLTADDFVRAAHRLEDLPDRRSSRLSLRPGEDGFASVDVAVAEGAGAPRGYADWAAVGIRAATEREAAVTVPGGTGQGETWTASWRWWNNRPRIAFAFAAPATGRLRGVWRVDASWEAETYSVGRDIPIRESRTHGGLSLGDWLGPNLRYSLTAGVDSWNNRRRAAGFGGSLERRFQHDRLAVVGEGMAWAPIGGSANPGFNVIGAHARLRPASPPAAWGYEVVAGATRASNAAPFSLWNGAGEGRARPILLRAHPLLDDGIIDATGSSSFGRSLHYASMEGQRWLPRPAIVRVAAAAFVDVAHASRRMVRDDGPVQTDVGVGIRLRIPGAQGMLRVDVAHGLHDGANALTFGWTK